MMLKLLSDTLCFSQRKTRSCSHCSWQMLVVLHTCLVLSFPLEMWISVFHNLVDNETRDWDGIKRSLWSPDCCFATDVRTAAISPEECWHTDVLRWIENIPDVPNVNLGFFLCGVPQGSHHYPSSRLFITETSAQSRPCCPFCVYTRSPACSEQTAAATVLKITVHLYYRAVA